MLIFSTHSSKFVIHLYFRVGYAPLRVLIIELSKIFYHLESFSHRKLQTTYVDVCICVCVLRRNGKPFKLSILTAGYNSVEEGGPEIRV